MGTEHDFVGPLNLGNPAEISIRTLAEIILELTGSNSAIVFKPLPDDDPQQRCPNIELARNKLGWEPKTDLQEGLQQTIAYYESRLSKGKILEFSAA